MAVPPAPVLTAEADPGSGAVLLDWAPVTASPVITGYRIEVRLPGAPEPAAPPSILALLVEENGVIRADPGRWPSSVVQTGYWEVSDTGTEPADDVLTPGPWATFTSTVAGTTAATVFGLPADVPHEFRVVAINADGETGSNVVAGTVTNPAPPSDEVLATAATSGYRAVLAEGGIMVSRIEVVDPSRGDEVIYSTQADAGDDALPLAAEAGAVDWSGGSTIQRSLDLTIVAPDASLLPSNPTHPLHWASNHRLRVLAGYVRADGVRELHPMATLSIDDVRARSMSGAVALRLVANDVTAGLDVSFGPAGWTIPAGTNVMDAFLDVIEPVWGPFGGRVGLAYPSTRWTTPLIEVEGGGSRRQVAEQLLAAIGCEAIADPRGRVTITPIPPTHLEGNPPTWYYGDPAEGRSDVLAVHDVERAWARPTAPNGLRLEGGTIAAGASWTRGYPPCPEEDAAGPCYWDATLMGNQQGNSFLRHADGSLELVTPQATVDPVEIAAVVWNLDPMSLSYYDPAVSTAPPRLVTYRNEYVVDPVQATAVAWAIFRRHGSGGERVQFSALPNPALQPEHVISFAYAELGIDRDLWRVVRVSCPTRPNAHMVVEVERSWNPAQEGR